MFTRITRLASVAALALAALAGAAPAATLAGTVEADYLETYNSQKSFFADATGANAWSQTIQIAAKGKSINGQSISAWATVNGGMFRQSVTDALNKVTPFVSYCMEVAQPLVSGTSYVQTTASGLLTAVSRTRLSRLVEAAWDEVVDARTAAAFQLAVWEIVEEGDGATLGFGSGNFRAQLLKSVVYPYRATLETLTQANAWLAVAQDATRATREIAFLTNARNQDLLVRPDPLPPTPPAPVPLPATALLLAGGLGGMAALRRRRAAPGAGT